MWGMVDRGPLLETTPLYRRGVDSNSALAVT